MQFRVRIFQPIVPEYRLALFDGLAARYGERLDVWAASGCGADLSHKLDCAKYDYSHAFRRIGPFLWQRGLGFRGLRRGDVVVVCGDIRQLSSIWIAFLAKCKGIRVVWWGHHKTATSTRISTWVRLFVAKCLSDIMLVYTKTGVSYLLQCGFKSERVFATGNTINQLPIKDAINAFDGRDPFNGRDGILCCSVLRPKLQLELLLEAMRDERLRNVVLAIIGDGVMKQQYLDLSEKYGISSRVIWIGGTRDQMVMAPWFLSAKAFVYPGQIGLSILHAFSYGLPVVVHENAEHQMPEYEVMENGKTGLCFKEGDVEDLVDKINEILKDEVLRRKMGAECQSLAFEKYSMNQMIDNFSAAIEAAAAL